METPHLNSSVKSLFDLKASLPKSRLTVRQGVSPKKWSFQTKASLLVAGAKDTALGVGDHGSSTVRLLGCLEPAVPEKDKNQSSSFFGGASAGGAARRAVVGLSLN